MAEKDFKSISNPRNSAVDVFPISKSENEPKRGSQLPNHYELYGVTSQGYITCRHSLPKWFAESDSFCFIKFFFTLDRLSRLCSATIESLVIVECFQMMPLVLSSPTTEE